jgi:hypothetical protein
VKSVAVDAFNTMYRRIDNDPTFAAVFSANAEGLIGDLHVLGLRGELEAVDGSMETTKEGDDS